MDYASPSKELPRVDVPASYFIRNNNKKRGHQEMVSPENSLSKNGFTSWV
jgi:hypothetical protein